MLLDEVVGKPELPLPSVYVPHLASTTACLVVVLLMVKPSAFNAKDSEIFLKLISCPMQVFYSLHTQYFVKLVYASTVHSVF